MNLRDLEYFVAVAELEHFGKAAERCFVSQPTLSGQIKKLEAQLGVKLFERTNRRVLLTDAGHQTLPLARNILRKVEDIREIAASCQNPLSGKFRLGAFPTLAPYVFPQLVPKVRKNLPDLRILLFEEKTEDLFLKLKQGAIDAALIALPIEDNYLEFQPLFRDSFRLAVPPEHELASLERVSQGQLRDRRLLLLEEGHCLRDQALEVCHLHGIEEEQDFKATSLETLRQMVKAGTGITFVPEIAIEDPDPGIHYIPFEDPIPTREIALVWRKTTARGAVLEKLIECLAEAPRGGASQSE